MCLRVDDTPTILSIARMIMHNTWPLDHLTTWPLDHLTTWPPDHLPTLNKPEKYSVCIYNDKKDNFIKNHDFVFKMTVVLRAVRLSFSTDLEIPSGFWCFYHGLHSFKVGVTKYIETTEKPILRTNSHYSYYWFKIGQKTLRKSFKQTGFIQNWSTKICF